VTRQLGIGRQVWNFTRHYLEMCVAMCVGGTLLVTKAFRVGTTLIGYPDLRQQYSGVALLLGALLYTVPIWLSGCAFAAWRGGPPSRCPAQRSVWPSCWPRWPALASFRRPVWKLC
jgi:hypothetical protein